MLARTSVGDQTMGGHHNRTRGRAIHMRGYAAGTMATAVKHKRGMLSSEDRPVRRYGVGNVTARCGDGCLDKLVVSVRRAKTRALPIRAGAMVLGAALSPQPPSSLLATAGGFLGASAASSAASTPLLLLGMLSGSAPRRDALRCTWMRVPVIARDVRCVPYKGRHRSRAHPSLPAAGGCG